MPDPHRETFVTLVAWHGPLSQLSARLGLPERQIERGGKRVNKYGDLQIELDGPAPAVIWPRIRRALENPPPGPRHDRE